MEEQPFYDSFKINFVCWKIFGIWSGKSPSKYYKYYSCFYVFVFLILYNAILTVNLFYTPLKIDLIIEEVIFYFNEVAIMTKVATILLCRKEILSVFEVLECKEFKGNDEIGRDIISKDIKKYKVCCMSYALLCNLSFIMGSLFPVIKKIVTVDYEIALHVSNYYILSDEIKHRYFGFLYLYQDMGLYGQLMYNVSIDSFIAGLIFYIITQIKILDHELRNLQWKKKNVVEADDRQQINELNYCLRHYETILKYADGVQGVTSFALFVQFGMASIIICVILCATLLPGANVGSLLTYLVCMTVQIFVLAWLGTQLTYKSQNLVQAAYTSEWVPRSEPFKSSIKLFMERTNTPIVITGCKLFILNLENFIAIMKTAYSFLTLVRNIQEDNN